MAPTPAAPPLPLPEPVRRAAGRVRAVWAAAGPYPADAALACLVLATMVALLRIDVDGRLRDVPWYAYPLITLAALPLVWRRRFPFGTALVVSLAAIAYDRIPGLPSQHLQYGALIGVYTVADRGPDAVRRWLPLLSLAGLLAAGVSVRDLLYGNMFPLLSLLTAYVLGCTARTRRLYAAALEERAAQLVRERDLETERAASRERERIAREMHDILGHAVALMVVQAEAGPVVVRRDPERAVAAFDAIAGAGRDAMRQLRLLLGVLSAPDDAGEADRAPQAGVEALADLVGRVREAGLAVEFTTSGVPRALAADVSLAVYRLVQESLTNTVRHAGASLARVTVEWGADAVVVEVVDDGTGTGARTGGDEHTGGGSGGGHGLVGLAQRVEAAGGTVTAGAVGSGDGFRVLGRLPYEPGTPGASRSVPGPGYATLAP